jgi:hypothetical protein
MTAVISREEADRISGDFEKICSREEKVVTKSNIKLVLAVVTVLIIILLVLIYLYFKGGLLNTLIRPNAAVVANDAFAANQGPQMPQPLFGGEQVLLE